MSTSREEEVEDRALWWSTELCEEKVHMVKKVLDRVGEHEMADLALEAHQVFRLNLARTLGGAFMKVLKKHDHNGVNLYEFAVAGEEAAIEKERNQLRFRKRNRARQAAKDASADISGN
jgi:hypothetical protein